MTVDDIKHGLVARNGDGEIIHFVGYVTKPTIEQAEHLREELRRDSDFGLGDLVDGLIIEEADWTTVILYKIYLKNELGIEDEDLEEGWD
ncbi:MAG: hypothetical protein ACOCQD_04285 [archaeon]